MNFLYRLMAGEFNFMLPISFFIMGALLAIPVVVVRYATYIMRKKKFTILSKLDVDKYG